MNVERLHRVAQLILDELAENDTRGTILRLRIGLETVALNPTDTQAQQALSEARTRLQRTLSTVPSNDWPPSDREILDEIGISNVIGQTLLDRIEATLAQNQMTPSIALEEIDPIRERLDEGVRHLSSLMKDLEFFGIGRKQSSATVPVMVTPSEAQFSKTFNTAEGGLLLIYPAGSADLGTSGRIEIAPQPGLATDVTVSASLFGLPGETDATTGGNVCIGQGIEWAVSEPDAIEAMRVTFVEAPFLTSGGRAEDAIAYKDGVPVEDSLLEVPDRDMPKPCIVRRSTASDGLWEITLLVDGSDPKGRI